MLCLPRGSAMSIIHPSAAADVPPMPTPRPWGRTSLGLTVGLALALAGAAARAATLTVTTAGEIADTEPLSRAQCSPAAGDRNCDTLRDAINHAADGDIIDFGAALDGRSEEHTSELQSHLNLVCRLLLEKKKSTRRHASNARPSATKGSSQPTSFRARPLR